MPSTVLPHSFLCTETIPFPYWYPHEAVESSGCLDCLDIPGHYYQHSITFLCAVIFVMFFQCPFLISYPDFIVAVYPLNGIYLLDSFSYSLVFFLSPLSRPLFFFFFVFFLIFCSQSFCLLIRSPSLFFFLFLSLVSCVGLCFSS